MKLAVSMCLSAVALAAGGTVEEEGTAFELLLNPGPQCVYTGTPPTAVSERKAVVRILSQNAFGLDRDGDENCKARGTHLGNVIAHASPPFDIVALQEHWQTADFGIEDCDPQYLTNAIWSTGRYTASNNYWRHRPRGEPYEAEADGALSIFSLHPIERFEENEWDDIPREWGIKVLHGSTFSRIKLNGTNIRLDVYNVHLLAEAADGCDPACRRAELEELQADIITYSRSSGNPVLVMGDFNIGGPPACTGNDSYADIMEVLGNPRDLWLENRPNSEGFTADCLTNSTLSSVEPGCTYRERIDFLFVIESPALTNSAYEVVARTPSDFRVTAIRRRDGGPVSDHFGLDATLEIRSQGFTSTLFRGLAEKCMTVAGGQTTDGTAIQQLECSGAALQRWTLGHDGMLRGLGGKCLTVRDASTANRTPLELRRCTGAVNQRFDYSPALELRSRLNPSKCVEVQGGFTADGTPVQLYDCNGTASQLWADKEVTVCKPPGAVCGNGETCCNSCVCVFNCGGSAPVRRCN